MPSIRPTRLESTQRPLETVFGASEFELKPSIVARGLTVIYRFPCNGEIVSPYAGQGRQHTRVRGRFGHSATQTNEGKENQSAI